MKFEFSRQIFEKVSNTKFNQNPSSGAEFYARRQTNMTKLVAALLTRLKTMCKRNMKDLAYRLQDV
jgi:hypothetical protein